MVIHSLQQRESERDRERVRETERMRIREHTIKELILLALSRCHRELRNIWQHRLSGTSGLLGSWDGFGCGGLDKNEDA